MTVLEKATQLVNRWVSQCQFLSPGLQGRRLIQMIATLVCKEFQEGYERGVEDGKATVSPFSW